MSLINSALTELHLHQLPAKENFSRLCQCFIKHCRPLQTIFSGFCDPRLWQGWPKKKLNIKADQTSWLWWYVAQKKGSRLQWWNGWRCGNALILVAVNTFFSKIGHDYRGYCSNEGEDKDQDGFHSPCFDILSLSVMCLLCRIKFMQPQLHLGAKLWKMDSEKRLDQTRISLSKNGYWRRLVLAVELFWRGEVSVKIL